MTSNVGKFWEAENRGFIKYDFQLTKEGGRHCEINNTTPLLNRRISISETENY